MTTSEAKRLVLLVLAGIVAIWLVLIIANEIDSTSPRVEQQTVEQLRQDLNDCHTALEVRGYETLFLLPPVSDEAIIKAWKITEENEK